MSLSLTGAEVVQLEQSIELLVSPLAYPDVDAWRLAVNRALLPLLRADSAGFLLRGVSGVAPMLSEEHDPAALARFPDLAPPPTADGTPLWERVLERKVSTLAAVYDHDLRSYHASSYFNEYAAPNRAGETIAAAFPLASLGKGVAASLHFWHARAHGGTPFGEHEVGILRLLFPAFRSGVDAVMRTGHHRANVVEAVEATGGAAMLLHADGAVLHQTRGLGDLLAHDPESASLRAAMQRQAVETCAGDIDTGLPPSVTMQTAVACYRLQSTLLPDSAGSRSVVLVRLERLGRHSRSAASLHEEFGLTNRELQVVRLLADGCSNATIAIKLGISPHTARRHTERVFQKLGVRSRAEISAHIHL